MSSKKTLVPKAQPEGELGPNIPALGTAMLFIGGGESTKIDCRTYHFIVGRVKTGEVRYILASNTKSHDFSLDENGDIELSPHAQCHLIVLEKRKSTFVPVVTNTLFQELCGMTNITWTIMPVFTSDPNL